MTRDEKILSLIGTLAIIGLIVQRFVGNKKGTEAIPLVPQLSPYYSTYNAPPVFMPAMTGPIAQDVGVNK